ncbi:HEAT repeat protein [Labilithrix luteola]|uniref:HEAT repeat protein n=1 Tax=Labilithrix luteola TaxID=1391654 RepID=A0A0K1Q5F1_9BACT|nr:HEAT repeat domain-containing protein [Labilithrix luteola]AKV00949.1 HEAT repeat protein [Labilithrix luteola]
MLGPPPLPRNLEASVRDLDSARPEVRVSAIDDLLRHARSSDDVKARAVPLYEKRLADADPRVRSAAAVALGELSAKESIAALSKLVDDDDAYVRQMAINALGEIGDAKALPRLERALRDARPEVRYQAIIAFARASNDAAAVTQALLDATNDDDDAIVHIALRVAEERLEGASDTKKDEGVDDRLVVRARALLKSPSPHVALVAAIFLGKAGHADGHTLLLRVVRGDRRGVDAPEKEDEQAAVELVGELELEQATRDLERRVWGLSRWVRDTCAFHAKIALARMNHPRARAEILRDLASSRREVRAAAVVAAGRAKLREAREAIARLPSSELDPALAREALARIDAFESSRGSSNE